MAVLPKSTTQTSGQMRPRQAKWEYRFCCTKPVECVVPENTGVKRANDVVLSAKVATEGQRRRCKADIPSITPQQTLELPPVRKLTDKAGQNIVRTDIPRKQHEYLFLWDDESGFIIKYPLYEEQQNSLCRSLVTTYPDNKKDDDDVPTDTRVLNWSLHVVEHYLKEAVALSQTRKRQREEKE